MVPELMLRCGKVVMVMVVVDGDAMKWLWLVLGSFKLVAKDVEGQFYIYRHCLCSFVVQYAFLLI